MHSAANDADEADLFGHSATLAAASAPVSACKMLAELGAATATGLILIDRQLFGTLCFIGNTRWHNRQFPCEIYL